MSIFSEVWRQYLLLSMTEINERKAAEALQSCEEDSQEGLMPPDGGWGWMVLIGAFVTVLLCSIPLNAFGIILGPYFEKEEVSSTLIAWIFSGGAFFWNFFGPFYGPLCIEFGWRKIAIFGAISNSLSVILSGIAPSPEFLIFSFSLLGGIGGGIGLTVSLIVISRYFNKRRGFAMGIVASGACGTMFLGPFLARELQENYGYSGGTILLGAVMLNSCVAGALYQPVEWHMKSPQPNQCKNAEPLLKGKPKSTDVDLRKHLAMKQDKFRQHTISECSEYSMGSCINSYIDITKGTPKKENNLKRRPIRVLLMALFQACKNTVKNLIYLRMLRVLSIALAAALMMLGYVFFQMWIVFAILDNGHPHKIAIASLSSSGIANFVTRLFVSLIADREKFPKRMAYIAGNLMIAASIVVFTLFDDVVMTIVSSCLWGVSVGWVMTLYPLVMIETMGIDLFPTTYGTCSLFVAFFFLIAGPIIGFLRDATNDYDFILRIIAGSEVLSALLWTLMPWAESFDKKREEKLESIEMS